MRRQFPTLGRKLAGEFLPKVGEGKKDRGRTFFLPEPNQKFPLIQEDPWGPLAPQPPIGTPEPWIWDIGYVMS